MDTYCITAPQVLQKERALVLDSFWEFAFFIFRTNLLMRTL
jgi:hypothetical protein